MRFDAVVGTVIGVGIVLLVMTGIFMVERAKWRECRRYHPTWYCVVQAGK